MTQYAISLLAAVPVRQEASETAEQTTQLIFADRVQILKTTERWLFIQNLYDGEQGWVDKKMLEPITEPDFQTLSCDTTFAYTLAPFSVVRWSDGQKTPVSFAARLHYYSDGRLAIAGRYASIDDKQVLTSPLSLTQANLKKICEPLLGIPYLWGGKNGLGMDCSGFTQLVMRLFGCRLKRNAKDQALDGMPISSFEATRAGDMLFFCQPNRPISHVGIALNSNQIIHCSGQVRIDEWDEYGIWKSESGKRLLTHSLCQIRHLEPNIDTLNF